MPICCFHMVQILLAFRSFVCAEIMSRRRQRTFRGSPVCPSPCRRTWSAAGTGTVRPDGMVAWYYGRCFRRLLANENSARPSLGGCAQKWSDVSVVIFAETREMRNVFLLTTHAHSQLVDKNNVFFLSYRVCTPGLEIAS